MNTNILLDTILTNTDSYKLSQFNQYPEGTEKIFSYIESRGGEYDTTVFFGLQIFLKEYLSKPITQEMIDEADAFTKAHGVPFNREGWEYIVKKYDGNLPVRIRAVPEGTQVPVSNILASIENTDPNCAFVTSYLETALLRAIWYPTTVATGSKYVKNKIAEYLNITADSSEGLAFKLHDFGARGVSSFESAGIGGAAHLVNFMGTDTITGVLYADKYYDAGVAGFSIPATEHSTMTSWGKDKEVDAYRNMLNQYKEGGILAVVSDSYDFYNACENIWGGELKQEVIDSGAVVVIRPDSGEPVEVVVNGLRILEQKFGSVRNDKGYRLLNNVRIIQGDGINPEMIVEILEAVTRAGFSTDNVAFGMGGGLLQQVDRDTQKFAMKASAAMVNGIWRDVYKDPVTDTGKRSKKGRLTLVTDDYGNYRTVRINEVGDQVEVLTEVFNNGKITKEYTFDEVRENSNR